MKKYLLLFFMISTILACSKDNNEDNSSKKKFGNNNVLAADIKVVKGDAKATLTLNDPRPYTEYYPYPPSNPDYFEVCYSENNQTFKLYKKVDISASTVTISGLLNGKAYYFVVKSIKNNVAMVNSDTVMIIPSAVEMPVLVNSIGSPVERVYFSYDKTGFTSIDNDKLYYQALPSGVKTLVESNTFEAVWSPDKKVFVYITDILENNTLYPFMMKTYDSDTKEKSILLEVDYHNYYISSPQFMPGSNSLSFLSSENNPYIYNYDIWKLDLITKAKSRLSNFEMLNFSTGGEYSWASNGEDIYLDGNFTGSYLKNIYKFSIKTGVLDPVIVSDWNDKSPKLSPDNSKLSFISDRSGKEELWLYNLVTHDYKEITSGSKYYFDPRYTNVQWQDNDEILITMFDQSVSKAVKIKVE